MANSHGGKDNGETKTGGFGDLFFGSATVGERGQIVVPAEARKRYGIETGDKLLIMGTRSEKGLMLFKIDTMREFMTNMLEDLQRVEQEYQKSEAHHEHMEETHS